MFYQSLPVWCWQFPSSSIFPHFSFIWTQKLILPTGIPAGFMIKILGIFVFYWDCVVKLYPGNYQSPWNSIFFLFCIMLLVSIRILLLAKNILAIWMLNYCLLESLIYHNLLGSHVFYHTVVRNEMRWKNCNCHVLFHASYPIGIPVVREISE